MRNVVELMMTDTSLKKEVKGEKIKSSHWDFKRGFYTVQIYFNNFKGRVGIQATLEIEPEEDDWFPIYLNTTKPFLEYPRVGSNEGKNGVETYSFSGNFVWLRAIMDRKNFSHNIDIRDLSQFGSINKIILTKL